MRTSKKILSFFLAVVMVVTTCSVGFTAFAKSNDNPLWKTTSVDTDSAFDTLNKLADQLPSLLMGIEAISKPVYEKGAKKLGKTAAELTTKKKSKSQVKQHFRIYSAYCSRLLSAHLQRQASQTL